MKHSNPFLSKRFVSHPPNIPSLMLNEGGVKHCRSDITLFRLIEYIGGFFTNIKKYSSYYVWVFRQISMHKSH